MLSSHNGRNEQSVVPVPLLMHGGEEESIVEEQTGIRE